GSVGGIVRSCHQDWDWSGYPDGLAGTAIPRVARIVRCCDAFSAMTTDRSYRKALPVAEAVAELHRCSGTDFDPEIVHVLADIVGVRPQQFDLTLEQVPLEPVGGEVVRLQLVRPLGEA